jgi:hypothetical protein
MGETCNTHGRDENAFKILIGKSEWKEPLDRTRRRWYGNFRMDLRGVE